jgi:hypothetical protein
LGRLVAFIDLADEHNLLSRPITVQPQCNLLARVIEWEIVPPASRRGSGVILGVRTPDQPNNNLAAAGMTLGDDEMHLLHEVSEPDTPDYPYGEKGQMQRSRRISDGRFWGRSGPVSRAGAPGPDAGRFPPSQRKPASDGRNV